MYNRIITRIDHNLWKIYTVSLYFHIFLQQTWFGDVFMRNVTIQDYYVIIRQMIDNTSSSMRKEGLSIDTTFDLCQFPLDNTFNYCRPVKNLLVAVAQSEWKNIEK